MRVILHAGAHSTDEDKLVAGLIKNSDILNQIGTSVPRPHSYRMALRDAVAAQTGQGDRFKTREALQELFPPSADIDRLVLSNEGFFGTHKMAIKRVFYPAACTRLEAMERLFPDDDVELFFALRNPATFTPAIFDKTNFHSIEDVFRGYDPLSFRWSEFIDRIRDKLPDLPITVWCNEDTPMIWAEVLREMGGLVPTQPIEGEFDLLAEIMTEAGMTRFTAYMDSHPNMTEVQKRRVIAAFLDKFADEEKFEEEYELDGWTNDIIDQMTDIYEEDIFHIQRIPGVNVIAP